MQQQAVRLICLLPSCVVKNLDVRVATLLVDQVRVRLLLLGYVDLRGVPLLVLLLQCLSAGVVWSILFCLV